MKRNTCLFALLIAAVTISQAAMLKVSGSDDGDRKAKLFSADPQSATLYVFRDNAFIGSDLTCQLVIDNMATSETKKNQFSVLTLKPGSYELMALSAKEKNGLAFITHNKNKKPIKLTVNAGDISYLQEAFSAVGGFSLKEVSAVKAQTMIKKGRLDAFYQP